MNSQAPSLAAAIAICNGYNVSNSTPSLTNNPGLLEFGDIGFGVTSDGVTIFSTPAMGLFALQTQANHILLGDSKTYSYDTSTTTLADVAQLLSPDDSMYLQNLSNLLAVNPSVTMASIATGQTVLPSAQSILPANNLTLFGVVAGQSQDPPSAANPSNNGGTSTFQPVAAVPIANANPNTAQNQAAANSATMYQQLEIADASMSETPWFGDRNLLTGNPRIRASEQPVSFQVFLNNKTGEVLKNPTTGAPIILQLNASLQSINILSKHIYNRQPSRTGMHLTFWGMAADTISGTCTTGVFMNQYGITDYYSTAIIPQNVKQQIAQIFLPVGNNAGSPSKVKSIQNALLINNNEALRVAAQDAFTEFLKLFQMNGVVWYYNPNNALLLNGQSQTTPAAWSPNEGATNFQQNARNNDVRSRGSVVMKYRNNMYLGYFKSLTWTMDAEKPFQWVFNFTFQVERTLTAYYYPQSGG